MYWVVKNRGRLKGAFKGLGSHTTEKEIRGAYMRYLNLVELLQKKGLPVRPVSFERFKANATSGGLVADFTDVGPVRKAYSKYKEDVIMGILAAELVAGGLLEIASPRDPLALRLFDEHMDVKEFSVEDSAYVFGRALANAIKEINGKALKGNFARWNIVPADKLDLLPKIAEEVASVLREEFGDPTKVIKYIAEGVREKGVRTDELEKKYAKLSKNAERLELRWLRGEYKPKTKAPRVPAPPPTDELKKLLSKTLKDLPKSEQEKVLSSTEKWVLRIAGEEGRLEALKESVSLLINVVKNVVKVHEPAVAAALLKAIGELGLKKEEIEALGRVLSDPATKKLTRVLKSKHSIKEIALYLAGAIDAEDLKRIWVENFPRVRIPRKVLEVLAKERIRRAMASQRFQILGEALDAVERAENITELKRTLEMYSDIFGKHAERLMQLANLSEKLIRDKKFRKLAEKMETEMFAVTPGTVTKVLKLADALEETLGSYYPALEPIIMDKKALRQVVENIVKKWWARRVDPREAEHAGKYAAALAVEILQKGGLDPKRTGDLKKTFLRLHFGRNAAFLTTLSQKWNEMLLSIPSEDERLPEKKIEVFETTFKTLREHYPPEITPAPRLEIKRKRSKKL